MMVAVLVVPFLEILFWISHEGAGTALRTEVVGLSLVFAAHRCLGIDLHPAYEVLDSQSTHLPSSLPLMHHSARTTQTQAIRDDGDGTEGHRRRRPHGVDHAERRKRNQHYVVGEGPEEVLPDDLECLPRQC